jgi:hypothetical protein
MTIEDAWFSLKTAASRITTANENYKGAFTEEILFDHLLAGLPEEYSTTRSTIDVQSSLSLQDKLHALVRQQDRIAEGTHKAFVARNGSYGQKHQSKYNSGSDSENSQPRRTRKPKCWACKEVGHLLKDCPLFQKLQEVAKELRKGLQKEGKATRDKGDPRPTSGSRPTSSRISKRPYTGKSTRKPKERGHIADYSSSESNTEEADSVSSTSEDEDKLEEVAAITQDLGNVSPSSWIVDSGATSHMTDQHQLFRSLTPIKRRTIKVGGGKLYAEYVGDCELRAPAGGTTILKDVLFVPNLGANLLSSRKTCTEQNIEGWFDSKAIHFIRGNKKIITADIQKGIYIISWIAEGLEDTVFHADELRTENQPLWSRATTSIEKPEPQYEPQQSRTASILQEEVPSVATEIVEPLTEGCTHQAHIGDSHPKDTDTDEGRERPETTRKRFQL